MRFIPHPPEIRAEAKRLGETTTMTCTEIAARVGVAVSTVLTWKRADRWKRPPGAPARRTFTAEQRDAVARLREDGASFADIARALGRDPDTVSRAARRRPAAAAPAAAPFAERAPEEAARLHAALSGGGLGRRELLRLLERAFVLVAADALLGRDPLVDRRAQALARAAATIKALPDDAPAAGDSLHDHQPGPATFDETNALLEEIARRFADLGVAGEIDGAAGGLAAADAAGSP